jgi:hypothetical protein
MPMSLVFLVFERVDGPAIGGPGRGQPNPIVMRLRARVIGALQHNRAVRPHGD